MPSSAGTSKSSSQPRRRGSTAVTGIAVLLLLGGGTAVAAGVADQDADPTVHSSPTSAANQPTPERTSTASATAGSEAASGTPAARETPAALPVEVRIPAINVQSELITVGLDEDGSLQVPQPGPDYDKAAWYDASTRPGDPGAAVIEGHVDSAANGPSIFYRLGELVPGDEVQVIRSDGSAVNFLVDEIRAVPKADFPTLEVYGRTPDPQLRLITCGGDFSDGHYLDNTVIFAHLA